MYDSATRGIMTAKHDLLQFIDYLFLQLSIDYLISIIHLKLILDYEKFSYINHHYKILTGHIPWSNDVQALHKQKFVKKRWRWTVRVMRWLEGNARRAMLTAIKSLSDTFLCHILSFWRPKKLQVFCPGGGGLSLSHLPLFTSGSSLPQRCSRQLDLFPISWWTQLFSCKMQYNPSKGLTLSVSFFCDTSMRDAVQHKVEHRSLSLRVTVNLPPVQLF